MKAATAATRKESKCITAQKSALTHLNMYLYKYVLIKI